MTDEGSPYRLVVPDELKRFVSCFDAFTEQDLKDLDASTKEHFEADTQRLLLLLAVAHLLELDDEQTWTVARVWTIKETLEPDLERMRILASGPVDKALAEIGDLPVEAVALLDAARRTGS